MLPTEIPDKGRVLTAMSVFWFELLADVVGNHLVSVDDPRIPDAVLGRSMLVRRLDMLPVECVARGYLTGSGLLDYRATGAVCGIALPAGLVESSQLPEPIFTPAHKAELGAHDENISYDAVVAAVGDERAAELRDTTLALYRRAAEHAGSRGVILADTKFEFGVRDGVLVLGDEVLTPDSSRYWPADSYAAGPGTAVVRQAVRPGLADLAGVRLGPARRTPRRRRCRPRWSTRPGPATSRPTNGSPDGRSPTGPAAAEPKEPGRWIIFGLIGRPGTVRAEPSPGSLSCRRAEAAPHRRTHRMREWIRPRIRRRHRPGPTGADRSCLQRSRRCCSTINPNMMSACELARGAVGVCRASILPIGVVLNRLDTVLWVNASVCLTPEWRRWNSPSRTRLVVSGRRSRAREKRAALPAAIALTNTWAKSPLRPSFSARASTSGE